MKSDIQSQISKTVYPVVRIRDEFQGFGSGVVISSFKNKNKEIETYILTNSHVISSCIHDDFNERILVDIFNYDKFTNIKNISTYEADIIQYTIPNSGIDLALLKLTDKETKNDTVNLLPNDNNLLISSDIISVSFQMNIGPIINNGILSVKNKCIYGNDYYLITSPCFYGSSGGATYWYSDIDDKYYFIGLITMLENDITIKPIEEEKTEENKESQHTMTPVIYHIVYVQPIKSIRTWLSSLEIENLI